MKIQSVTLAFVGSLFAFTGSSQSLAGNSGGGGGGLVSTFILTALQMANDLELLHIKAIDGVKVSVLKSAIKKTKVFPIDKIFVDGDAVAAAKLPGEKFIHISTEDLPKVLAKSSTVAPWYAEKIIVHEYLRILGKDDDQHQISSDIVEALKTGGKLAAKFEQDKDNHDWRLAGSLVGTKMAASYPIEEQTFIPVTQNGETYLTTPNGLLAQSCMANLQSPLTLRYVIVGDYTEMHSPYTHGWLTPQKTLGVAASAFAQGEREATWALRRFMESEAQAIRATNVFDVVPLGFTIHQSDSEVSSMFGSATRNKRGQTTSYTRVYTASYTTQVNIQYVVLNKSCSAMITQIRERLKELREQRELRQGSSHSISFTTTDAAVESILQNLH